MVSLFLLALVAAGLGLGAYRRTKTFLQWRRGKVEVAQGCTVLSPGIFFDQDHFEETADRITPLQRDGRIELFETPIGSIWYPTGSWTLPVIVEKNEADVYRLQFLVKHGDVVFDVGANVGTEARSALAAGASLVVAIEPEPLNLECLRRNLISEIREKRAVIVPKGAWDKEGLLPLHLDPANAGGASFIWQNTPQSTSVQLTTIDQVVTDLHLKRVDVIKVHAEGAESKILLGAAETLRRYHPRLAINLEHHVDDAKVLPAVARHIWPGYRTHLTSCTETFNRIHPSAALLTP